MFNNTFYVMLKLWHLYFLQLFDQVFKKINEKDVMAYG